jgi:hypothetical protein
VSDPLERVCIDALRRYLDDVRRHQFLTFHADRERNRYVQFSDAGDRLYGDATGDEFLRVLPLDQRQRGQRAALGWSEEASVAGNPSHEWPYPVDLEAVARATALTLVDVFDLRRIGDLEVETAAD